MCSGPLTSADVLDANGKGLKVAYQVLDETRLLFQFFTSSVLVCVSNNLNGSLSLVMAYDSGLPWGVQRGSSKKGIPEL